MFWAFRLATYFVLACATLYFSGHRHQGDDGACLETRPRPPEAYVQKNISGARQHE